MTLALLKACGTQVFLLSQSTLLILGKHSNVKRKRKKQNQWSILNFCWVLVPLIGQHQFYYPFFVLELLIRELCTNYPLEIQYAEDYYSITGVNSRLVEKVKTYSSKNWPSLEKILNCGKYPCDDCRCCQQLSNFFGLPPLAKHYEKQEPSKIAKFVDYYFISIASKPKYCHHNYVAFTNVVKSNKESLSEFLFTIFQNTVSIFKFFNTSNDLCYSKTNW